MKDRLPPHFIKALDSQVSFLSCREVFGLIYKQTLLKPDDLRQCIHNLVLIYDQEFDVRFPALNSTLLLFRHVKDLALPREANRILMEIETC